MTRPFSAILIRILMGLFSSVGVYALGKERLSESIDSDMVASRGYREIGRMNLAMPPIKGSSTGEGIAVSNAAVELTPPAKHWKGHWDAGQFRLPSSGRSVLRAEVKGGRFEFSLQAYGGKILPKPDSEKLENNLHEAVWLLKASETQTLSALWLTLDCEEDEASAEILELSVWRTSVKNRLDADKILATPPVHRAELKLHNGAMTMFLDGHPITGRMWSSLCYHNVKDRYLEDVLNGLACPIAAIPFAVGENRLTNLYPSSSMATGVGWIAQLPCA